MLTESCTKDNQITYLYFCTLGGLAHPRCAKQEHRNGSHVYHTYYLRRY